MCEKIDYNEKSKSHWAGKYYDDMVSNQGN